MSTLAVSGLAPFGSTSGQGAFTKAEYPDTVFLLIEQNIEHVKAYNTVDRTMWEFPADAQVSPAEQVELHLIGSDFGAGFITNF